MSKIHLTDMKVKSLKPPTSGQKDYFDERTSGFGIRVSYGGAKSWFVKYVHDGKQRRKTLGQYPAISLADARKQCLSVKHQLAVDETDPAVQKSKDQKELTLLELINKFIEMHAKVKKKSWKEDQRILNKYFSSFHRRKAAEISKPEIRDLLQNIMKNNGGTMSNRCLASIRKVYNFGIQNGYIDNNPALFLDRPAQEVSRDRFYSDLEIRQLWKAFDQCGVSGEVFKMCLSTGQRLREVSGMRWEEIDRLEDRKPVWTIPKTRTKNSRTHIVPLSTLSIRILTKAKGNSDTWVFPSPLGLDQPVTIGNRNRKSVRDKSDIDDFRPHDLRRTVQTNITKLGFPRFFADRLLNHVEGGVGQIYDQYDYSKEKTEAMNGWSERLSLQIGNKLFG